MKKGREEMTLEQAVQLNCVEVVEAILKVTPNKIHIPNMAGNVPLHYAQSISVLDKLVEAGALLEPRNENGRVPLHTLSKVSTVQRLLKYGASPDIADCDGNTPLHTAKCPRVVKLLLQACTSSPHQSNSYGHTPLHLACSWGNFKVVRVLLFAGASSSATYRNELTPQILTHQILKNTKKESDRTRLNVTIRLLDLWQKMHVDSTAITPSFIQKFDSCAAWIPLKGVCKKPQQDLSIACFLPEHVMKEIIETFVGPWLAAPSLSSVLVTT